MLRAVASSDPANIKGSPLEAFLVVAEALAYVQSSKPAPPASPAIPISASPACAPPIREGAVRFGRYRIVPDAGNEFLSDSDAAAKAPTISLTKSRRELPRAPSSFMSPSEDLANDGDECGR